MGYDFNADEIFVMAERIEENGADFYNQAAEKTSDAFFKKFLLELAEMGHIKVLGKKLLDIKK